MVDDVFPLIFEYPIANVHLVVKSFCEWTKNQSLDQEN
jgi:hypothetical protein